MKTFLYLIALAAICLACRSAFAVEGFRTAPLAKVNRWETVKFKVAPPLKPLAERLAFLEGISPAPDAFLIAAPYYEPPERRPKNPEPHERYAVVSDNRVAVERPDRALPATRSRAYYSSAGAKSFYGHPAGART
jgi:hypothetical protein